MNDGGPAFPHTFSNSRVIAPKVYDGMSIRDWFAGMALQTFDLNAIKWAADKLRTEPNKVMAEMAYAFADAMLEEREKSRQPEKD